MPKLRDLTAVDIDYATTGPNNRTIIQAIPASGEALFRCLEDGPAWKEWIGIDVEWTSPRPFGVGTTRTVTISGQQIDETFLAWDPGRRMCFRFDRCTLPLKAFAEDYVIVPKSDTACELNWNYAYEWGGPLEPVLGRAFGAIFALNGKRSLRKLAALMESTDRFNTP